MFDQSRAIIEGILTLDWAGSSFNPLNTEH